MRGDEAREARIRRRRGRVRASAARAGLSLRCCQPPRGDRRSVRHRRARAAASAPDHARYCAAISAARPSGPSNCGRSSLPFGVEHLAARVHQRGVVPARERRVLVHCRLRADAATAGAARRCAPTAPAPSALRARSRSIVKNVPVSSSRIDRLEMRGARALERRRDHDLRATRTPAGAPPTAPPTHSERHSDETRHSVDGDRVHLLRVIPHGRPRRISTQRSGKDIPACLRRHRHQAVAGHARATCSLRAAKTCRRRAGSGRAGPSRCSRRRRRPAAPSRGLPCSCASGRPAGQKYFVSSEKYLLW